MHRRVRIVARRFLEMRRWFVRPMIPARGARAHCHRRRRKQVRGNGEKRRPTLQRNGRRCRHAGIGAVLSRLRQHFGLGMGRTISLDKVTLTSRRLGLTGRVDRLIRQGSAIIPEEWKSGLRVNDSYKAQIGCYFVLIEEKTVIRPGLQPVMDEIGADESGAAGYEQGSWHCDFWFWVPGPAVLRDGYTWRSPPSRTNGSIAF